MKSEIYEKRLLVEGFKPVDFTPEGGSRILSCKITYSYQGNGETEFGRQTVQLSTPYENCEKLKNCKFPVSCVLQFSIDNLNYKPKVLGLKVVD